VFKVNFEDIKQHSIANYMGQKQQWKSVLQLGVHIFQIHYFKFAFLTGTDFHLLQIWICYWSHCYKSLTIQIIFHCILLNVHILQMLK